MSLPRPLLELAWLRLNGAALLEQQHAPRAFANHARFALASRLGRRMHTQMHPPEASPDYGLQIAAETMDLTNATFLRRRERPMRLMKPSAEHVELKSRLDDLLSMPVLTPEQAATEEEQAYGAEITEEQLRAIYVDLLAPAKDDAAQDGKPELLMEPDELLQIVESLEARLAVLMEETVRRDEGIDEGLAAKLLALQNHWNRAVDAPAQTVATAEPEVELGKIVEQDVSEPATAEVDETVSASEGVESELPVDETELAPATDETDVSVRHTPRPPKSTIIVPEVADLNMNEPTHRVLARLDILLNRWRQDGILMTVKSSDASIPEPGVAPPADDAEEVTIMPIGLSVITLTDWNNILHASIQAQDAVAGDVALQLMQRARVPIDPDLRASVLKIHADVGNVECAESFIARHCPVPNLQESHLRVKSYAHGGRQSESCVLLHQYEARGVILPIKTYHSVIMCLLYGTGPGQSQRRAQAWDMFAHMRYVAHPVPDRRMYAAMIRACSIGSFESDAERAMDMWTEMTMDHKMEPDIDSYNAIIRVCARNKRYLMEAFRFARQMMDESRDAHGIPSMSPNYHTFVALLQAAKRMGALSRARWLFAEILRIAAHGGFVINDILLQHIFHTYATYRPPYDRTQVPMLSQPSASVPPTTSAAAGVGAEDAEETTPTENSVVADVDDGSTSSDQGARPPNTAQVLAEVDALFNRVTFEQNAGSGLLSQVKKTAFFGNAYLAVYCNHADFPRVQEMYKHIFIEQGYPADPATFLLLIFKVRAVAKLRPQAALGFAWDTFSEWQRRYGDRTRLSARPTGDVLNARTHIVGEALWSELPRSVDVEHFWANMIDILAFADQLDDAMTLVRKFEYMYPPLNMREPLPMSPLRSMRTSLFGQQPIIRLSSTTQVADDTVPPMLLFSRVEVLHQRLLLKERVKDIKYLTWLTSAYKGSLEMRRDAAWGREKRTAPKAVSPRLWPKLVLPPSQALARRKRA
ncbi:hypothetical protein AURDEDRAFT_180464 [Auricularia subglabra TFB-10046 SS5]|nr:hypothetical protein AURDEDRAFT_180464 [Auricularia subglabra TFB-10046 SS5]